MKTYTAAELPQMAAAAGNPGGKQAPDDVQFNDVTVVQKGQYYNPVYLAAIDEGCAEESSAKPKPSASKGGAGASENKGS